MILCCVQVMTRGEWTRAKVTVGVPWCVSTEESGTSRAPQAGDTDVPLKATLVCMLTFDTCWIGLMKRWTSTEKWY